MIIYEPLEELILSERAYPQELHGLGQRSDLHRLLDTDMLIGPAAVRASAAKRREMIGAMQAKALERVGEMPNTFKYGQDHNQ